MSRRAALKICWLGRDCQYVINTTGITPAITINHFTLPQSIGVCYFDLAMSSRTALKICWFGSDCQYVINTAGITPSITINHFTVPQSAGVRYFTLQWSAGQPLRLVGLVVTVSMSSTQLASHPLPPSTTLLCLNLLVSAITSTLKWAAGQPSGLVSSHHIYTQGAAMYIWSKSALGWHHLSSMASFSPLLPAVRREKKTVSQKTQQSVEETLTNVVTIKLLLWHSVCFIGSVPDYL